jgi:predicted phosphate transport protein (TIGR00153 family)
VLKLLLPRDGGFFNLFRDISDLLVAAANEFSALLKADGSVRELHTQRIKDLEHKADSITHQTMTELHKTFITPIDREDIHRLIKRLDDIMDFMDAAAQRVALYDIGPAPEDLVRLADINTASCELVKVAVAGLSNLKNTDELTKACVEINRLENEADTTLRIAVAKLFKEEQDVRQLIKLKEIYELLETVSDRCEDVATVIDSIVIEYS